MSVLHNFRIKLLLNNFFNDHRQKVFVIINQKWLKVNELQCHIQKLFQIEADIYLTCDGILLPAHEHINVITPNDELT